MVESRRAVPADELGALVAGIKAGDHDHLLTATT